MSTIPTKARAKTRMVDMSPSSNGFPPDSPQQAHVHPGAQGEHRGAQQQGLQELAEAQHRRREGDEGAHEGQHEEADDEERHDGRQGAAVRDACPALDE